jgi:hypothetical protein
MSSDPFAHSFKPELTQLRNQLEHKSARNASTASDFDIDLKEQAGSKR